MTTNAAIRSAGGVLAAMIVATAPGSAEVVPLPPSVEVTVPGAFVRTSPSPMGARRGTLALGARLRPEARSHAGGCNAPWYLVAPEAWVCGEHLERSRLAPEAVHLPVVEEGEVVPGIYGFAAGDGARRFPTLELAEAYDWDREYAPSSGLHFSKVVDHYGDHYYRLAGGGYVAAEDVRPARPSTFSGVLLAEGDPAVAWVGRRGARVRPRAGGGAVVRRLGKRSPVPVLERRDVGRTEWVRIDESEWVLGDRLVEPDPPELPPGLRPDEKWIDVHLETQVLTAYEGSRAVFATLVSTGRRRGATPEGIFRIWVKLATGEMADDGGEDIDDEGYLMQDVPWVMYFNEGVALHGVYWHNEFGRRRSHGCVNMAPRDAEWLFAWTEPSLPPGWAAVLPTASERGTIVVVR